MPEKAAVELNEGPKTASVTEPRRRSRTGFLLDSSKRSKAARTTLEIDKATGHVVSASMERVALAGDAQTVSARQVAERVAAAVSVQERRSVEARQGFGKCLKCQTRTAAIEVEVLGMQTQFCVLCAGGGVIRVLGLLF